LRFLLSIHNREFGEKNSFFTRVLRLLLLKRQRFAVQTDLRSKSTTAPQEKGSFRLRESHD